MTGFSAGMTWWGQVYLAGGQGLGLDVGLQAADVDEWLGLLGAVIEEAARLGILAP